MKRDDLFEHGGGGSKARMLQYILYKAISEKYNCILTAGGPYSNFNRALALLANKYHIKMKLVLYDKNKHIDKLSLNRRILEVCNVDITECDPNYVAETINYEMELLKKNGFNPYYIWGGGKSNEGVEAYKDCFVEIKDKIDTDYIFTALGTGTTFSGLIAGNYQEKNKSKVIGISVAREVESCKNVVMSILNEFDYNITLEACQGIIVDDYLFGGYGGTNNDLNVFINNFIRNEGMIVDTIYVGKALYGTINYLEKIKNKIKNKNIVFINTGGIYNF